MQVSQAKREFARMEAERDRAREEAQKRAVLHLALLDNPND